MSSFAALARGKARLLSSVLRTCPTSSASRYFSAAAEVEPKKQKGQRTTAKVQPTEEELTAAQAASQHAVNSVRHTVYSNNRANEFAEYQARYPDWKPYADAVTPDISFQEYRDKFSDIDAGARLPELGTFTLCGRISTKREASNKLYFIDIVGNDAGVSQIPLQVICSTRNMSESGFELSPLVKKGDWIAVTGYPGKSKTNELSIIATDLKLLTPCLQLVPQKLTDPNIRFRNRHLDLIVNQAHTWDIFRTRTTIFSALRQFLAARGFVEVETPILWPIAGGATARPFVTTSNAFGNNMALNLRIAPELFLKQLVIGGMERVFELSKVFRNEGIDATHNPEFTSCELYMAHADYNTMMDFTEELLKHLVQAATGGLTVALPSGHADPSAGAATALHDPAAAKAAGVELNYIDFSQPFTRLDVIDTLRAHGIELPENYNEPEAVPVLRRICEERGWEVSAPFTNARLMDKMIGEIIEPLCVQPTFIVNHPVCLSPLAKQHRSRPGLTERFELFIGTKEYCNAYSELNVPAEQYQRLVRQQELRNADGEGHDNEAHPLDTPFCEALEYGLPPTGGWGLGVDRLVMLLARVPHIRDVIFFPIMKPQGQQTGKEEKKEEGEKQ